MHHKVKRFTHLQHSMEIVASGAGEYVLFKDYQALAHQVEELNRRLVHHEHANKKHAGRHHAHHTPLLIQNPARQKRQFF